METTLEIENRNASNGLLKTTSSILFSQEEWAELADDDLGDVWGNIKKLGFDYHYSVKCPQDKASDFEALPQYYIEKRADDMVLHLSKQVFRTMEGIR